MEQGRVDFDIRHDISSGLIPCNSHSDFAYFYRVKFVYFLQKFGDEVSKNMQHLSCLLFLVINKVPESRFASWARFYLQDLFKKKESVNCEIYLFF